MTFSTGYDWAKPGVKVVCINSKQDESWNIGCKKSSNWVIKCGETYTIREVTVCPVRGNVQLRLIGIKRDIISVKYPVENGWHIKRFKPLVTKELPQSITCLLKNPRSVILPNEGNRWDVRKAPVKSTGRPWR